VEGIQGIEKVRLGNTEFDARLGVADDITELADGKRVRKGKIVGITAGSRGYPAVDGILGVGLASSVIQGLRNVGARGIKITFKRKGVGGNNKMEVLTDTDCEKGVVWYNVETQADEPKWEIILNKILFENQSVPVFRAQKVCYPEIEMLRLDACRYRERTSLSSLDNNRTSL
jgi:hypothetical protein